MNIATRIEITTAELSDTIEALELFNGIDEGENTDADRLEELVDTLKLALAKIADEEHVALSNLVGQGIVRLPERTGQ